MVFIVEGWYNVLNPRGEGKGAGGTPYADLPFSGFRYVKGKRLHKFRYMKMYGNLPIVPVHGKYPDG